MIIGFVGMGNMASALLKGFTSFAGIKPSDVYAYAPNQEKLRKNADLLGFNPCGSLEEAVAPADFIIMACKPYQIEGVLEQLGDLVNGKAIISVAFGWDFEKYSQYADTEKVRIQYIIPNTPVSEGEGIILMEDRNSLSAEERNQWKTVFSSFATVEELDADHMSVGSALAGCGPAFVDVFIEALADGAVKNGMTRDTAYRLTPQMIKGAAVMMQNSGMHPGQLKDMVCSPGGTTIKGVAAMEEGGVRSAMIKAVDAACGK